MDIFAVATRNKYRFPYKGVISVEDLWDLPVTELDRIYKYLNNEAKKEQEESLLKEQNTTDQVLTNKIEIIKYIVSVKLNELKARAEAAEKKERKQRLLEILAKKEDQELEASSVEQLKKMLEELD